MPKVYGSLIDTETRCRHYFTEEDIIAIKFKCCNKYYPCYKCHNEFEKHAIKRWHDKAPLLYNSFLKFSMFEAHRY